MKQTHVPRSEAEAMVKTAQARCRTERERRESELVSAHREDLEARLSAQASLKEKELALSIERVRAAVGRLERENDALKDRA